MSGSETVRVVGLVRADLPPGWSCWKVRRLSDETKWDHYMLSSEGRKFRSQKEVNEFIAKENPELGQITFKVPNLETAVSEEKDSKPTANNQKRNLHQSCIKTFFAQRTTANATMKGEPEIATLPPVAVLSRSSSNERSEDMQDGSSNSSHTDTNSNVLERDITNIVEEKYSVGITADADVMSNEKDVNTAGDDLDADVVKPTPDPGTDTPPILETKPAPEANNVEEADADCGGEASPKPEEVPTPKRKRGRPKKSAIEDKECPSRSEKTVVKHQKQKIDHEKGKNPTNSEKDPTETRFEDNDVCEFGKDEAPEAKNVEEAEDGVGEASPKPEEVPPPKRKRGRPKQSAIEDQECPSRSETVVKKRKIDSEKEYNPTNSEKDATETMSEEFGKDELQYIKEIEEFMKKVDLDFQPKPLTKGDGNCWYRAAAAQVEIHDIPNQPRDHKALDRNISKRSNLSRKESGLSAS